jgi:putative alpha-1,2-mannosidase
MMMAYVIYTPHFMENTRYMFSNAYEKHFGFDRDQRFELRAHRDMCTTLNLLTDGYLTAWLGTCFIPDNVNNPGGCSTYRSFEVDQRAVQALMRAHPEFVKARRKQGWINSEGKVDMDIIRMRPHVQWKKSFSREKFEERTARDATSFAMELYEDVLMPQYREMKRYILSEEVKGAKDTDQTDTDK